MAQSSQLTYNIPTLSNNSIFNLCLYQGNLAHWRLSCCVLILVNNLLMTSEWYAVNYVVDIEFGLYNDDLLAQC